MKKILAFLSVICILITGTLYVLHSDANATESVAILPLDSRPCNTQYVQQLGMMANIDVILPSEKILDDFLEPSNSEELWQWLEETAPEVDHLILTTNQLFNGGLLNSRNSESYHNIQEQLDRLKQFCLQYENLELTVITVMPRLLPSQFDKALWEERGKLVAWGQALDQADLQGTPAPQPPDVPQELFEDYAHIYKGSQLIVEYISQLAKERIVSQYIVGQDDAEAFGPSNMIIRNLTPTFSKNISVIHGADELTMLALADFADIKTKRGINILYSNPELKDEVFPYEAAPLSEVIKQKLDYLDIKINEKSNHTLIVHNDPDAWQEVEQLIPQEKKGYVGIIDIAYTNRGDTNLYPLIADRENFDLIDGYAGWNTASNAIGTVIAHMQFYHELEKNILTLDDDLKNNSLTGFIQFKYVRIVEDLLYQGIIKDQLVSRMESYGFVYPHMELTPIRYTIANTMVQEIYTDYREEVKELFNGPHTFSQGLTKTTFKVDNFSSNITLPWNRIFEIKANCGFYLWLE